MAPNKPEDWDLEQLQQEWKAMFQQTLPRAATSKPHSQPKWPVHVDHCFARIILDSVVGIDTPWTSKIKSPAYKNMSAEQLQDSIALGQNILDGKVDLVELDSKSLKLRGKGKGTSEKASGKLKKNEMGVGKRKVEEKDEEEGNNGYAVKKTKKEQSPPALEAKDKSPYFPTTTTSPSPKKTQKEQPDPTPTLKKIALSTKTPFQKQVLTTLCQVPRGKYTTYGLISAHLSSSPRAVGNALRENPFAPQVPCHRVLASGGGLGGFKGSWGKGGESGLNDDLKRKLLREEGVMFDGKGKVVGEPWRGFK